MPVHRLPLRSNIGEPSFSSSSSDLFAAQYKENQIVKGVEETPVNATDGRLIVNIDKVNKELRRTDAFEEPKLYESVPYMKKTKNESSPIFWPLSFLYLLAFICYFGRICPPYDFSFLFGRF